jgi:hypothetical protein
MMWISEHPARRSREGLVFADYDGTHWGDSND